MSIANYIKDDLAARLRSGKALPMPLTLGSLAGHYQVSFTPVRTAIAELLEEGLLKKGANRRLAPATTPQVSTQDRTEVELPTPPRDFYQEIANDLVQQSLQGDSIYLREELSAEKYDISRSAIRHIFHRLAGEGMLDHIPRHGWLLRPFRQEDLQDFIEVREVLERKALDLAKDKLETQVLEKMLAANSLAKSSNDRPKVDESLHGYLITTAGNQYIRDFFERQGRYYQLLFQWEDHDQAAATETVRQHQSILNALISKDWREARRSLSHHICNNHPILSQIRSTTAGPRHNGPPS